MTNNKSTMKKEKETPSIPTPKDLYNYLCEHVIGQEEAKKTLSVAIYNHYKRLLMETRQIYNKKYKDISIDKTNVLMMGPTGCGKTYMIKTLAKTLGVPCYVTDCTKLTQSGYVGDDVENCLTGLLNECDQNVQAAEWGIVILDEGDKLARKGENVSITRDVGGEGVQQSLLKIVEGSKVAVPPNGGRKHPEQKCIEVDTTNILFIMLGAFDGIEEKVARRMNRRSVGFNQDNEKSNEKTDYLDYATTDDLKSFGLIPELIGRFPIVTHVNMLTENDMVAIMKDTKNSIVKQYQKMLFADNVDLTFTDEALKLIAKKTIENKTGARGLKRIIENLLFDIMFENGGNKMKKKVCIDEKFVNQKFNSNKSDIKNKKVA